MPYLFGDKEEHVRFEQRLALMYNKIESDVSKDRKARGKGVFGADEMMARLYKVVPAVFEKIFESMSPVDLDHFITAAAGAAYAHSLESDGFSYKVLSVYSIMSKSLPASYPAGFAELAELHQEKFALLQDIPYARKQMLTETQWLERETERLTHQADELKQCMLQLSQLRQSIDKQSLELQRRIVAAEKPRYGISHLVRVKAWRQAWQAASQAKLVRVSQSVAEVLADLMQQQKELTAKMEKLNQSIVTRRERLQRRAADNRQRRADIETQQMRLDTLNSMILRCKEWLPAYALADRVADDTLKMIVDGVAGGRAHERALAAVTADEVVNTALFNVTAINLRRRLSCFDDTVMGVAEQKEGVSRTEVAASAVEQAVHELMAEVLEASSHKAAVVQHMTATLVSGAFAQAAERVETKRLECELADEAVAQALRNSG